LAFQTLVGIKITNGYSNMHFCLPILDAATKRSFTEGNHHKT
jgi:hypothetical protein